MNKDPGWKETWHIPGPEGQCSSDSERSSAEVDRSR